MKLPVSTGSLQTMYLVVTSREDVMTERGWHHLVAQYYSVSSDPEIS